MIFHVDDKVIVYNKWPGVIKGSYTPSKYIVEYVKNGISYIGIVESSRIKKV